MMNKVRQFIEKYSFFIFIVYVGIITIGSLWPRFSVHYQTGEISSGQIPQNGENFKMVNDAAVYRLEDGQRRQYTSDTSFFNHSENKPFDTPYENGGILICDKSVVFSFPMGDYMPLEPGGISQKYKKKLAWDQFKEALFRRDKVVHFFSYLFFAMLLLMALERFVNCSTWFKLGLVFGVGTIVGGSIELLQFAYIPGRDKELLDLIFNSFGLIGGMLVFQKLGKRFLLKKKLKD